MSTHKAKQYYDAAGHLLIKPYRLKDLSLIFDVRVNTLKKWMQPYQEQLNREGRHYYTVQQVQLMVEKFGLPHKIINMPATTKQAA